jgi:hypothetical protein
VRPVGVIGISKIFVFKYQKQRLRRNWRQSPGQICDIARPGARCACYEQGTQSPPTVPKPFVEALPTHTQGFDHTPTRTYKIGRSFPAIGLIFSGSIERQPPFAGAIASCGTMKLIYPAPDSR